jgi:hypothetical protein
MAGFARLRRQKTKKKSKYETRKGSMNEMMLKQTR